MISHSVVAFKVRVYPGALTIVSPCATAVSFVVLRSPKRQLMKDGLPMQGVFQAFAASATQRCATVAAIFGENFG